MSSTPARTFSAPSPDFHRGHRRDIIPPVQLPTSWCPRCRKQVLVHRTVASEADPLTAPLETHCVECDERLDRFGLAPAIEDRSYGELQGLGYGDWDKPAPIGAAGCFVTRGCDDCSKKDSRPW